jgi:hypothetical protein
MGPGWERQFPLLVPAWVFLKGNKMGLESIKINAGVPVEILGQKYYLAITMLGLDYLEEEYGSMAEAMKAFQKMGESFKASNIDKEARETLSKWVLAALIHNQFDNQGNKIKEIPSLFELKSGLKLGEFLSLAPVVLQSYQVSFPEVPADQEEKAPDPQKA